MDGGKSYEEGTEERREESQESGREVESVVKRREREGERNRMEGIWKGREKEKEVEKGWKNMKEVIGKRRKERRLKIMEDGNGRKEEAKNM